MRWSSPSSTDGRRCAPSPIGKHVLGFIHVLYANQVESMKRRRTLMQIPADFASASAFDRFVLSLVLANLMSALVTIPAHVCNLLPEHNWPTGFKGSTYWDQTLSGLTVLITLASVLSILLISLDRYYAVNSPLHYTIIVTRQKSVAMITLVWLVSVILSAPVWSGGVTLDNQLIQAVSFFIIHPTAFLHYKT